MKNAASMNMSLILFLAINPLLISAQFEYLIYPFENRVCQVSELNLDDFSGFRIQTQSITGYSYYHTRISFCDLGTPDLDDAYYPVIESSTIPWATKICALDIYNKKARESRPRCFIMARRKEFIPELWEDDELMSGNGGDARLQAKTQNPHRAVQRPRGKLRSDEHIEDTSRIGTIPAAVGGIFRNRYRPGTWIGGLFECPGLTDDDGIKCTDQNAMPILPLIADNPLGWWSEFPDTRHYVQRVPILYTFDYSGPYGKEWFYGDKEYGARMGGPYRSPFAPLPPDNWQDLIKATENYTGIGYIEDLAKKEGKKEERKNTEGLSTFGGFLKSKTTKTIMPKSRIRFSNDTQNTTSTQTSPPLHKINSKTGRGRYLIRKPNNTSGKPLQPTSTVKSTRPVKPTPPHPLFDKGDGRPRRPVYSLINGRVI